MNSSQNSQTSALSSVVFFPEEEKRKRKKRTLNHQLNRASDTQLSAVICKKEDDSHTSLAAVDNLFLISATDGDLDGPAWGLSFPGAGV